MVGFRLVFVLALTTLVACRVRERVLKVQRAPIGFSVPTQYIVLLHNHIADVDAKVSSLLSDLPSLTLLYTYDSTSVKGFTVQGVEQAELDVFLADIDVSLVQEVRPTRIENPSCLLGQNLTLLPFFFTRMFSSFRPHFRKTPHGVSTVLIVGKENLAFGFARI